MAADKSLIQMQQRSEQRKADILCNHKQSLFRFQQMSEKLTNEDIDNVRIFVGACLIEDMALDEQLKLKT